MYKNSGITLQASTVHSNPQEEETSFLGMITTEE